MKILYVPVKGWPPLVWLAVCKKYDSSITVYTGERIEKADDWFCEAVWAGSYELGDFDLTDIIAGSGGRVRDGKIVLVSAGNTVDRLNSLEKEDSVLVSNSLTCLLSSLDATVPVAETKYTEDLTSIGKGIREYKAELNTSAGLVKLTYFDNLLWDGQVLKRIEKPFGNEKFDDFNSYREYLDENMRNISGNAMSDQRKFPYSLLGALSSGYDSVACAVLGKPHGLEEAITSSFARRKQDDSGKPIAPYIGLNCIELSRDAWRSLTLPEPLFISGDGGGNDMFIAGAASHLRGRVLLSGYNGDTMWGKNKNLSEDIIRNAHAGLSLTEYRLRVGFINCAIPFWGARRVREVCKISRSDEMRHWDVPGNYSRPISRRIVEEAGVPRELFGMKKKGAAHAFRKQKIFLTPASRKSYIAWLKNHRDVFADSNGRSLAIFPTLDRVYSESVCFADSVATEFLNWTQDKPFIWQANRLSILRKLSRLSDSFIKEPLLGSRYLLEWRNYLFPWAIEQAKKSVPSPFRD